MHRFSRTRQVVRAQSALSYRRISLALIVGAIMLFVAGCGESTTFATGTPTATKAPADQTCTRQKNPPQRQPAGVSASGWSNPHGYAVAEWKGAASSLGATIDTVMLSVSTPSNQFIDNELWLSDNSNNWVETGYGTFSGGVSYSFWADNRPSTSTYYLYVLDKVSVGTPLDYNITGSGNQSFTVYVSDTQNCTTFTSVNNPLNTSSSTSDIGMEIYDSTSGAPHCSTGGLSDPSPNYTNLGIDPALNSSNYNLIDDASRSINAAMSPTSGAPTSLTTSC
jgi:hypothetical protein